TGDAAGCGCQLTSRVMTISDHPCVSWLQVSALQVAAVPVVFGMLTAAHFLGQSKPRPFSLQQAPARQRPLVTRQPLPRESISGKSIDKERERGEPCVL